MSPGVLAIPPVLSIIHDCARITQCDIAEIVGCNRQRRYTRCRFAIAWVASLVTSLTTRQIGEALGGRDHATIEAAIYSAQRLRSHDPGFEELTARLFDRALDRKLNNQREKLS